MATFFHSSVSLIISIFRVKKQEVNDMPMVNHVPNLITNETIKQPNSSNGSNNNNNNKIAMQFQKRYTCTSCPYSTDRRDLFTRHENIHKEDKPFHCYVCLKQFNRADHVKKHFLRMHRSLTYDIGRTRRSTPQVNSVFNYFFFLGKFNFFFFCFSVNNHSRKK